MYILDGTNMYKLHNTDIHTSKVTLRLYVTDNHLFFYINFNVFGGGSQKLNEKGDLHHKFSFLSFLFFFFFLNFSYFVFSEGAIVKSSFTSHRGWVSGVSWSPNNSNHFISGSYDMLMKLWDMRRLEVTFCFGQ